MSKKPIHKHIAHKIAQHTTKANPVVLHQTADDARNALVVVSVFANLFMLTGWLIIESTESYNAELIAYLLQ